MPASRNYASKDTTTHICPFGTTAKSSNKCYHFKHAPKFKMQMPDILLLTGIGSLPKKKRKEATKTTIFVLLGNHDSLHFAIIPLTPSATKTIILDSPKDSPRFGQKRKITIHCHYSPVTIHPSLFTGTIHRYCSLQIGRASCRERV